MAWWMIRALKQVSGVIQRFLDNMTQETGYSFYLVGGGLDVRYNGSLRIFEYG